MTEQQPDTVAFEFMINLHGLTCYVCQACGAVLEMDAVDIHAEAIHKVNFISMLNIPIGSEENHVSQGAEDEYSDQSSEG